MFDDVCSTFLLKECFAFDQTFRPTMLKRLAGFSTLLNKQMLYNNVRNAIFRFLAAREIRRAQKRCRGEGRRVKGHACGQTPLSHENVSVGGTSHFCAHCCSIDLFQRQIRHHITCSSSNLIYMIQCSKCNMQYIGETKRHLSDRFGEHRRAIEKAIQRHHINQPTAVPDHFSLPGHSINNIELIPLELIKSNRDGIRKARVALLISKGNTLEPHGINRRDET